MGVPSLLRMWLISKPFTLCSPTCSVLHTAHFACSQGFPGGESGIIRRVLNRSAILVGSEIPYLAEQRKHARKINSIFIQVQAKTRSEEKDELHMTGN
ncbi:hypothetical protein APTSU1_001738100 [Apodemus speciosus]|uniref:Secreted protein n=1 Tax=Apodemus speciosus TaxID=105296 RepID=A0ABQ0FSC2_APOSI